MTPRRDTPRRAPERPFVLLAAALCSGSLAGSALAPGATPALGLGALLLAAAALARARRARTLLVLVALACFGAARAGLEGAADLPGRWRVRELCGASERGTHGGAPGLVEIPRGLVADGDLVRLTPRLAPAPTARGPVPHPLAASPFARAARPRLSERLPDEVVRLQAGGAWPPFARWTARLRSRSLARLEGLEDPTTRGLCAALLLGDTSLLDPEAQELYVRTGTWHLLVVSGTQVVLLGWLVFRPLARLLAALVGLGCRRRLPAEWLAAPLLALYVPLAGAEPPVLRAALVFGLVPFAPRSPAGFRRRIDPWTLWAVALSIECLADPRAAVSLSVQLSYAATLALILCSGATLDKLRFVLGPPGLAEVDRLGRPRPRVLCVVSVRLARALRTASAASLVAVLATAPLLLLQFQEFAPSGMLATVLLLPSTTLLLVLSALQCFFGLAPPAVVLDLAAHATESLAQGFDALPLSPWPAPERPFLLWVAAAGLALAALRARAPEAALRRARLGAALGGVLLLPWTAAPRATELVALDVGHGTAVLARTVDGSAWVFDAGSRDRSGLARVALAPLLAAWDPAGVSCVLSHAQRDHDSALDWLVGRYPPDLWAGALPAHLSERFPHATPRVDLAREGVLELGRGAWLLRGSTEAENEASRSLVLAHPEGLLWLSGDAEGPGLRGLLGAWREPAGAVRLLLLPHHGSDTPELGRLLERLAPAECWASASEPPAVAAELARRGLRLRWTGAEGALQLGASPR